MKRKEISQLAIDLIEEALAKPKKTIALEKRITKPICEPGIKEPTEQELDIIRDKVRDCIVAITQTPMYSEHVTDFFNMTTCREGYVRYKNKSKIYFGKWKGE